MGERRVVRAALTQTVNAYPDMPTRLEDLPRLAGRLDEVRRANVDHHLDLLRRATAEGARAVCFGELFTAPYFALRGGETMWLAMAEDAREGETVRAVRAAARELGVVVVAPLYELDPASGRRFNTAVVIDADGELLGSYRKTHVPEGQNDQGQFAETFYYQVSDGQQPQGPKNVSRNPYFPVFETAVGRVGVATCYDRHFAGALWTLALEGAELVFSPAITFGTKSRRMWQLEFPVDACRHNIYIGGSNRRGQEPPWNQPYFGESYFVGPNGPCPDLSRDPALVIADLDLGQLAGPDPAGWNIPRDTRPDIYSVRPLPREPRG